MRLSFPPMEPDPEAPLSHLSEDAQALIKSYTQLVEHLEEEVVFLLDGKWGSGKTTLARAWQAHLEKEGKYDVIYIDAFLHDFNDDPLFMIGRSISKIVDKKSKDNFHALLKSFEPIATELISASGGHAVGKVFSAGMHYVLKEDGKEKIEKYKEELEKYAKNKKIVIFIDELDRCRPDFSITTLEKIKHIFSVEGVIFILVANTVQLNASLKGIYGKDIDAQEYWKKFIGRIIDMPPIKDHGKLSFLRESFESVKQDLKILKPKVNYNKYEYEIGLYSEFLYMADSKSNLTYRQLQKLRLEICFALVNNINNLIFYILIYLRCQHEDLYRDIQDQNYKKGTFLEKTDYLDMVELYAKKYEINFLAIAPAISALVKALSPKEYEEIQKSCNAVLNPAEHNSFERIMSGHINVISQYGSTNDLGTLGAPSAIASMCKKLGEFVL